MIKVDNEIWYFVLGFLAQGLFAGRMLIQWILSEKAKQVVSPTIFWQLSLFASILFSIYGWLRGDFVIILGQLFSYYIYIWNLNSKNNWTKIHSVIRVAILLLPVTALCYVLYNNEASIHRLFSNISLWLLLFGSAGQIIFTFRFVYQWRYSRLRGESVLPLNFWMLSITGSLITISYAIVRQDPVLLIGQTFGFVIYSRNVWLIMKNGDEDKFKIGSK